MTRPRLQLLAYQLRTGASNITTGILLLFAPSLALRLLRLHSPPDALIFLSCICTPMVSNTAHPCSGTRTPYPPSYAPNPHSLPVGGTAIPAQTRKLIP